MDIDNVHSMRTSYPNLRQVLAPEYREASDAQIETLFEYTDITAMDAEGFFSNVGSFFSNTARQVGRALPQIAKVAAPVAQAALPIVGTAIGGPVGGALGGLAGQAIGALAGPGQRPTAPSPRIPSTAQPTHAAVTAGTPPGGAASQLMQLLADPRIMQSLASLALGQAGSRRVSVGGTQVSPSAITNLLGMLANQATAEAMSHEPIYGGVPDYMGESMGDPAVAENRAAALLDLLHETFPSPVEWIGDEDEMETDSSDEDSPAMYEQYYDAFFDTGMDSGEDYDFD